MDEEVPLHGLSLPDDPDELWVLACVVQDRYPQLAQEIAGMLGRPLGQGQDRATYDL